MENTDLLLIMALLRAEGKAARIDDLSKESGLPEKDLLSRIQRLEDNDLIRKPFSKDMIVTPVGEDRLKLAITAVTLGATMEQSASMLSWKEFESFCMRILEENGYSCLQGFRFRSTRGKRFECDVVATRKPLFVLGDCKHYGGKVKGLRTVVKRQLERVDAFCKTIPTIVRRIPEIVNWREAITVPVIITLFPESSTIINRVPIVPAFKLNNFIQELPSNIESIAHTTVEPAKQKRLL
ncbi:MAG: restriction endonuclease [Candidatus Atabeyarchaeum deiterrae]